MTEIKQQIMKVKVVSEYMQNLDQDKNIWVSYNCGFDFLPPVHDSIADESDVSMDRTNNRGVEIGDYIINAW